MPTSRGLDVSSYQGRQDWAAHAAGGVTFAFAKASEGEHSKDPRFPMHIGGILDAELVPGAYHFGWPNQDPATEAANYTAAVRPYARPGFIHILDLERRNDDANYKGRTDAQIRAYAQAWVAAVQQAFPGQRVGVYTSATDLIAKHFPGNAAFLWYPAYPTKSMSFTAAEKRAQPSPSGTHPLFWQFTSTPLDRNLAYLSPAALREWAGGDDPDPTPIEHQPEHATEDTLPAPIDVWAYRNKAQAKKNPKLPDAYGYLQQTAAGVQALTAQVGGLTAALTALAKNGGLTGAEITAAAQAGADAALATLGEALTEEN